VLATPIYDAAMMPGGHLVTSVALSGVSYAVTQSVPFSVGCFLGGFLIDVDHYVDYLFFEKQYRKPLPPDFLRYYFECRPSRFVLPLHSWELMAALIVVCIALRIPLLAGYVIGGMMHLTFDVLINGEHALKRPFMFYSLFYRRTCAFTASALIAVVPTSSSQSLTAQFWAVRAQLRESASHVEANVGTELDT
jgi:hypothetical protein